MSVDDLYVLTIKLGPKGAFARKDPALLAAARALHSEVLRLRQEHLTSAPSDCACSICESSRAAYRRVS